MKKGFTLIELLVVVLIIGILAAMALPKYQMAVDKARVSTVMPLIRSLADAQRRYIMSNGTMARKFSDLDIALPSDCQTKSDDYYGETATCDQGHAIYLATGTESVAGVVKLSDKSAVWLTYPATDKFRRRCLGASDAAREKMASKICASLGAVFIGEDNGNSAFEFR